MVLPQFRLAMTPSTQPKQWNSGTGRQIRSFCAEVHVRPDPVAVVRRCCKWVSMTPLGNPVVPDVYCMLTTS